MEAKDIILSKKEIREVLVKANCPEPLIEGMGDDLILWWKAGWLQEILYAQKQAGIKEVVEWITKNCYVQNIKEARAWENKLKEWEIGGD